MLPHSSPTSTIWPKSIPALGRPSTRTGFGGRYGNPNLPPPTRRGADSPKNSQPPAIMPAIRVIRIVFLSLCILGGYAVSQLKPDLISSAPQGLLIGFGFGGLL